MKRPFGLVWRLAGSAAALLALLVLAAPRPLPAQAPGAAEMLLDGGGSGPVPFPHLRHQQALQDCTACHAAFPQTPGAIAQLKTQGALQPKQVMNRLCTACHKQKKAAGEKSGPVTFTQCHRKD